jgi:hypothetical protein
MSSVRKAPPVQRPVGPPNWLLRLQFQPNGVWLPPKPVLPKLQPPSYWTPFKQNRSLPPWSQSASHGANRGIVTHMPLTSKPQSLTGEAYISAQSVSENEARFWAGVRGAGGYSQCRACQRVCWGPSERLRHKNEYRCTVDLVEAYKLLLRDRKCVVCDSETSEARYGVPLHMETCIQRFRSHSDSRAIEEALLLVRYHQYGRH